MHKTRILLVDDMSSMRGVVKMFLHEGGFNHVTEASNGTQALTLLQHHPFDLIISDWDMPEMSGLELLEKVKQNDKLKSIPFVMLTATNNKDKIQKAIALGVNDYIAKPFQAHRLLGKLVKCARIK